MTTFIYSQQFPIFWWFFVESIEWADEWSTTGLALTVLPINTLSIFDPFDVCRTFWNVSDYNVYAMHPMEIERNWDPVLVWQLSPLEWPKLVQIVFRKWFRGIFPFTRLHIEFPIQFPTPYIYPSSKITWFLSHQRQFFFAIFGIHRHRANGETERTFLTWSTACGILKRKSNEDQIIFYIFSPSIWFVPLINTSYTW